MYIDPLTPGLYVPSRSNRIGCYNNHELVRFWKSVAEATVALGADGILFDHQ